MSDMQVVFISGVQLGYFALQGMVDSLCYKNQSCKLAAIVGLSKHKSTDTSGYRDLENIASNLGVPYKSVDTIKSQSTQNMIRSHEPDLIFIIGWSELAPPQLLNIPKQKYRSAHRHASRHGCIGIHPTALPIGRGRAPIPWTIITGLTQSAVSLFYLEDTPDSGDIIDQLPFEITMNDDASSIYRKVESLHYELMIQNLPKIVSGTARRIPQDESRATIWSRRRPEDGLICWNRLTIEQYNWIRGLTRPYPGSFTHLKGTRVVVWKAMLGTQTRPNAPAGTITSLRDGFIEVACNDGHLNLEELEATGDLARLASDFASRYGVRVGDRFSDDIS